MSLPNQAATRCTVSPPPIIATARWTAPTSAGTDAPYLLRWDYDLALGGPIIPDKFFWFVSGENIHENRQLNFTNPENTPQFIIDREERFNEPTTDREARVFAKLDQVFHSHHLTEEFNYTNLHINSTNPLSASTSLPSTRTNLGDRNMLIGAGDTITFGSSGNPLILSLRGQYRREPTRTGPAHPDAGPNTIFNIFSGFGYRRAVRGSRVAQYGADFNGFNAGSEVRNLRGQHRKNSSATTALKFGYDFERTQVDGVEAHAPNRTSCSLPKPTMNNLALSTLVFSCYSILEA